MRKTIHYDITSDFQLPNNKKMIIYSAKISKAICNIEHMLTVLLAISFIADLLNLDLSNL